MDKEVTFLGGDPVNVLIRATLETRLALVARDALPWLRTDQILLTGDTVGVFECT